VEALSKLILRALEDLLDWFGRDVRAVLVVPEERLVLIVMDDVEEISVTARTEIWRKIYDGLRGTEEFKEVAQSEPPIIIGVILSGEELEYHSPRVMQWVLKGEVLLDPDNILNKEREAAKTVKVNGEILELAQVKEGEVFDL
jgi:hypothetical protein